MQNLRETRAGTIDRGAQTFFERKKGGRRFIWGEKKRGQRFFWEKKKGAETFFWKKIKGARTFLKEKGGRIVFLTAKSKS